MGCYFYGDGLPSIGPIEGNLRMIQNLICAENINVRTNTANMITINVIKPISIVIISFERKIMFIMFQII